MRTWIAFLFALVVTPSIAQTYLIDTRIDTSCSGTFYDDGGATGSYANSKRYTYTLYGANGNRVALKFSSFRTHSSSDYLRIYDGPNTSYPVIGTFSGTNSPDSITSTGKALTFYFYSSSYSNSTGWAASISCAGTPLPAYNIKHQAKDTVCEAVFYDDQGPATHYSQNGSFTHTFYADTSNKHLHVNFNALSTSFAGGDTLWIFDGPDAKSPLIGAYVSESNIEELTSSSNSLTFRWRSDGSSSSTGWQAFITCDTVGPKLLEYKMSSGIRYVCSGTFSDDGGQSVNYSNGKSLRQTFVSETGGRLVMNFNTFRTHSSSDYLRIYDGPSTAYPIIGTYSGTNSPDSIIGSGKFLTFYFYSSSYSNSSGWTADISCGGAPLPIYKITHKSKDTVCEAVFYDDQGPAAHYSHSGSFTHTFYADTSSKHLHVNFNALSTSFAGGDTLWVFDGPDTKSPIVGAYVNGSNIEELTSSHNSLTFRWRSDGSSSSTGWQAFITCDTVGPKLLEYKMSSGIRYVCSGIFSDDGGQSVNYSNGKSLRQTFVSRSGGRLAMNFTSFRTHSSSDYLRIYDGPSTAYPIIGTYSGTNSPDSIIGSGKSLTFYFYSSTYSNSSGWTADISCAGTPLPIYKITHKSKDTVCEAVFYDDQGPATHYSHNGSFTHTFYADTSNKHLHVNFNALSTSFAGGDTLWVFDGPDAKSPLIGAYVSASNIEELTSSSNSLTFRWRSDGSSSSTGWQAFITCDTVGPKLLEYKMSSGIRYVCSGTFSDDGGQSVNYSNGKSLRQTFVSRSGGRLAMNFTSFRTHSSSDYLRIYDGPSTAYPIIGTYSGTNSPDSIIGSGKFLTFYFYSSSYSNSSGWTADISCGGAPLPIYKITHKSKDTVCEAVFYDDQGPATHYSHNGSFTHTFYADTSNKHLHVNFNALSTGFAGGDTLWVFDGPDAKSPLIGAYVSASNIEELTSSSNSLTFRWRSDGSSSSTGWQAYITCDTVGPKLLEYKMSSGIRYACSGVFSDDGGQSINYNNGKSLRQTFMSASNGRLVMNFTSFRTHSSSDYLRIYDGPSTAHPIIGTYSGTNSPDSIIASGRSLTFYFYSSSYSNSSGWTADISCYGSVLPVIKHKANGLDSVCEAVYYDNGGPVKNYLDKTNSKHVICSGDTTKQVRLSFNNLAFGLYSGDTLIAYDGTNAQAPLIGKYVSNSKVEDIRSTNGCVTLAMKADLSNNSTGWQAHVSCDTSTTSTIYAMSTGVRSVCSGKFTDDGGTSGYYSNNQRLTQTYVSSTGAQLRFVFKAFRTYNTSDYLRVYDGPSTSATLLGTYSSTNGPDTITSTGKALTFYFYSSSSGAQSGWYADIECVGAPPKPTISYNNPLCQGDDLVLTSSNVSKGVSYEWTGPNSFTSNLASPTIKAASKVHTGQYKLVVKKNGFASDTAYLMVRVNAVPSTPTISVVGARTFCDGDSVVLRSSYSHRNIWSNADTSRSITVKKSGTFEVRYTSLKGCQSDTSAVVQVQVNAVPSSPIISNSGSTTFCEGDSVVLSSSYTYRNSWSSKDSNQRVVVKKSGTYSVTYSTIQGCTATSLPVVVKVYTKPARPVVAVSGALSFCEGDSVVLESNYALGNSWSTNDTNQKIVVKASGVYSVLHTDKNGCESDASSTVTVNAHSKPAIPKLTLFGKRTFCAGDSLVLISSNSIGNVWNNLDTNQRIVVKTSGNIYARTQSKKGCWSDTSQSINVNVLSVPAKPSITPGSLTEFCFGDSVSLISSATDGNEWNDTYKGQERTVKLSGNYTVRVLGSNGCYSEVSNAVEVTVKPKPNAPVLTAAGPTAFCFGDSVRLISSSTGGNVWHDGAGPQIRGVKSSAKYYVSVEGSNGCVSDTSNNIDVTVHPKPPKPRISPSGSTVFCEGTELRLTSSSSEQYRWSTGETDSQIDVTKSGLYYVFSIDANACVSDTSDKIEVEVKSRPGKPFIVDRGNDTLDAGFDADRFEWFLEGSKIGGRSVRKIEAPATGNYQVVAVDKDCHGDTSDMFYFIHSSVEISQRTEAVIYPNPNEGVFSILLPEQNDDDLSTIEIYDLGGRQVLSSSMYGEKANLRLKEVPEGSYLIEVRNDALVYRIRMLIH